MLCMHLRLENVDSCCFKRLSTLRVITKPQWYLRLCCPESVTIDEKCSGYFALETHAQRGV